MKTPKTSPTRNPGRSSQLKLLTTAVALVSAAFVAEADHYYTNNATGDYNVPSYWDPNGVPGDNTHNNNGSANVVLIQAGDPIWQHGDTLAGSADGTSGAYLQTGSTNNTGGGNWLRMGLNVGAFGSYVISNGVCNVGGRIQIGEHGAGYLEVSGGTMRANVNDSGANPGLAAGEGNFGPVADNSPVGTVVINSGTLNIGNGEVWFGNGGNDLNSRGTGHLIMHGGTFNINNWFVFGRFGAAGDGFMDGGVINKSSNGNVQIGVGTMNSGSTAGQGYFTQLGGTFNCGSEYQIGTDSSLVQATNDIGGSAVLNVDNWLAVGRSGATGVLNISNNAAITKTSVHGGNITIGTGSAGHGTVNQYGGAVTNTAAQTWIAEDGTGVWNMYAGMAILGTVQLGHSSAGYGTLNLAGGVFRATSISSGSALAISELDFNGGTLQAGADSVNFISGLVFANVGPGGAVIDTQGYNVGVPQALSDNGGGGLTKLGSGTLTLSGANSYSGVTAINAGKLATTTASGGGGSYTVGDNTTLGVTVMNANEELNMTDLTLGNATGAALEFNLGGFGNPTAAPINVTGTLTVNGTIAVNITDSFPNFGQFPLIQFGTHGGSGNFALGNLPVGVAAYISNNVNSIDLVITNVSLPRWEGLAGGNWDIGVTTNWINLGNGLPNYYSEGDKVLFDDNALGTPTVNLTTTVHPNGVTVNNSAVSYTFQGSGKISGTNGITKTGDGSLTIASTVANDYTGKTVVSGGSLNATTLANGGSPSSIGASSADPMNLVLSGGTLVYSGPATTIDRGYTLQGINTNSTIDTESSLTLSGTITSSAGDGFNKTGPAQLAYTTVGSNNLASASYEVQDGSLLLDGSAGGQTNYIGGHLGVNGAVSAVAILTNTTLNCGDFYIGNQAGMMGSAVINEGTTINDRSWFILGDAADAVANVTMNGGTLNVPNGRLFLCSAPGTMTSFTMNGGTINKSGDYFAIVNGGWNGAGARTGVFSQVSGTINCQSECWVGDSGNPNHDSLGIYNLSGGTLTLGSWFGVGRDGASGVFNMTGGTINKAGGGDMVVGRGGSMGTFIMSAGAINKDAGNPIIVGQGGGIGQFDISGGVLTSGAEYWLGVDNGTVATNDISGTAQMTIHNWVTIGRSGTGVVNMTGGQFNSDSHAFVVGIWGGSQGIWNQSAGSLYVDNEIWIGQGDNNGYGTINLSGGTITNTSWLAIGREGAHGTLNISGGTMVKTGGGNISIAHNGGASGDVVISGTGTFICESGETWVGENAAPGTWTMDGGTAILGLVHLAQNADATGVMNLNGGSLTATEIATGNTGAAQRELNLNGGTIVAGADNDNFIHDLSAANVQTGGAIFNTAGHTVSVNQALLGGAGDGGLIKNGGGTLYLNGANTYQGQTTVYAGGLGGSGTVAGPVSIASGAELRPGTTTIGTLTIGSSLVLSNASSTFMKISLDGGTTNNDLVTGLTSVSYDGSLVVNNVGAAPLVAGAVFKLFNAGSASGNFSSVTVLPSGAGTFNPATGELTITVGGPLAIASSKYVGGNLILTGTGGTPGGGYTWLTSTNLTMPVASWDTGVTGAFDSNGSFSNAIPVSTSEPARFFRLRQP